LRLHSKNLFRFFLWVAARFFYWRTMFLW
jgi:hypothetical protein